MPNAITRTAAWRFFYVQIWRRIKLVWLLIRAYAFNLFVAADNMVNTVIGGDPGETISSRLGKGKLARKPVHTFLSRVVDVIFEMLFSQRDHCVNSIQHDEGKGAISEVIDRYNAGEKQIWKL
ncbi:hypothetical protein ACTXGQ_04140 [Marinobacter sp. 1Y8]